jgi:AI-2 transport protein TqsA
MPASIPKLKYDLAPTTPPPPLWGVVVVGGLVLAGVGLRAVGSIVGPVFLVLTLVITVYPLRVWLVRHRVPQVLASIVALLAVYAMLIAILASVVWSLTRLVSALTDYSARFTELYTSLTAQLSRLGLETSTLQQALSSVSLSSFVGPAQTILNGLTSGLSLLTLMVITVFFLVFDAAGIEDRIALIRSSHPQVADALEEFASNVRLYWIVTSVFGLIVAALDLVALLIIGVPMALTWAVLAFVTNYIPNVGFVLGLLPPALIALLEGGPGAAIAVVVVYTLLNVIVQTLIQPRLTGDAVGITGTVAFLSLIFWAYLLGALGALLAVPATLFVKALLVDNSGPGRWFGALINAAPRGASKARPGIGRTFEKPDSTRSNA